jgi:hypothetical protein
MQMRDDLADEADWVEPECVAELGGDPDEVLDLKLSLAAVLGELDLHLASAPAAVLRYAPPPVWLYRV